MEAKILSTSNIDGAELIEINGHEIQFGYGGGGDGYCYVHGSFECIYNLSPEEWEAVQKASAAAESRVTG